jgi:hypothetical protein
MSYIRSGSNPEQLYIWGDGTNVFVVKGPIKVGSIPKEILHEIIRKYDSSGHDGNIEHEGAELKEVWVDSNEKELLPNLKEHTGYDRPFNCKLRLSYNGWYINMWYVTWFYIVSTNLSKTKNTNHTSKDV